MEFLGIWKLKEMLTASEEGLKILGVAEIEALEENEDNKEFKHMQRADFIISETSLDIYYKPLDSELEQAKEEGWEITEKGILVESFPSKIEDGVFYLDYEKEGKEYFPVDVDEEGCLIISDGLIKIRKA